MITKRSKRTIEFDSKSTAKQKDKNPCLARVHYPVLKPPRTATPTRPAHGRPAGTTGIESRQAKAWGGDPGAQKRIRTTPAPTARPAGQSQRHLPHQQPVHTRPPRGRVRTGRRTASCILRRKEVIQPHLPVRLPCYDLVPITSLTLDGSIHKGLGHRLRVLPTFMT